MCMYHVAITLQLKTIYGTFGVEMRAYGRKLVKFCTHTDTHVDRRGNLSSIDMLVCTVYANPTPWSCKYICLLLLLLLVSLDMSKPTKTATAHNLVDR